MNKNELHQYIAESAGNAGNICQICAFRDGKNIYEDSWRGFTSDDAVNINSVTKGVMAILAGIAVDKAERREDGHIIDNHITGILEVMLDEVRHEIRLPRFHILRA